MNYPTAPSSAPTHATAPLNLAIGVGNSWFTLDDAEDQEAVDAGWHDTFDDAAYPYALNPFVAQPLVYPADDSGDKEFNALLASVQDVKGLNVYFD